MSGLFVAALGHTDDPAALVPGDPAAVLGTAEKLAAFGATLDEAGQGLRRIDSGAWTGSAADAFRDRFDEEPGRWLKAGDAFLDATDAGEATREQARDLLRRARDDLDRAGDEAERIVAAARDQAPPKPSLWKRALGHVVEFGKGFWDSALATVQAVWATHPVRLVVDPRGYADAVATNLQAAKYAVANPVEFAKAVVDWDAWRTNPAYALGALVPDIPGRGAGRAAKLNKAALDGDRSDAGRTPLERLTDRQRDNYRRYEKKLPAKHEPIMVEYLPDGEVRLTARVPASNIPGSYAEYIKVIGNDGNTVRYTKDTYGPDGELIHSKPK